MLGEWGPQGTRVVAAEAQWRLPLRWDREAREAGERRRVFCASLADVFEDWRGPMEDSRGVQLWARSNGEWTTSDHYRDTVALTMTYVRARLLKLIHMTPHLDWLLLTKRPEFIREAIHKVADYVSNSSADRDLRDGAELAEQWLLGSPMPNIWLGVSVEDQRRADDRIPLLLQTPAAVRFLSVEPLLGPVDLRRGIYAQIPDGLHWVIVGGESGPGARPMQLAWARSLVRQCQAAHVPVFVKQLGARPLEMRQDVTYACEHEEEREFHLRDRKGGDMAEWPEDLRIRDMPD